MPDRPLRDTALGTWHLVGWSVQYDDGTLHKPFGDNPSGVLVYSADGGMAVCLHDPNPLSEVPTFAYAGRYHIENDKIIHEVLSGTATSMIGSTAVREAEITDQSMVLSVKSAKRRRHDRISWRRIVDR